MKLTIARLFDFASIASTKAAQEIKPFIDFVNSSTEQIVRALTSQLTLEENIKGQIIRTRFTQGVAQAVSVSSREVLGVISLKCQDDAVDSFLWSFDAKGQLSITVFFKSLSGSKDCAFFAFFA